MYAVINRHGLRSRLWAVINRHLDTLTASLHHDNLGGFVLFKAARSKSFADKAYNAQNDANCTNRTADIAYHGISVG